MKYNLGSGVNLRHKNGSNQTGNSRVPPGPTCYYCKWKGYVKTECLALAKKTHQRAIVAPSKQKDVELNHHMMGEEKVCTIHV